MNPMVLNGLLFTEDPEILSTMNRVLDSFAIETQVALCADEVLQLIGERTYDAIFVDFKDKESATGVVGAIRDSKRNHQTLVMIITDESEALRMAFGFGVRLSMPRPKSIDQALRCLRPSYTFMLRHRKKTIRFDTSIAVEVLVEARRCLRATVANLSETGAGLALPEPVPVGARVEFDFLLPGTKATIHAEGRIVWSANGKAGMAFSLKPSWEQLALEEWIAEQIRINNSNHPVLSMRPKVVRAAPGLAV